MFPAKPAQAATFTVDGTAYDVTVIGQSDTLLAQLETTPWWGNEPLAVSLASKIGVALGTDGITWGYGQVGPLFAHQRFTGVFFNVSHGRIEADGFLGWTRFAVGGLQSSAAAVPEPLTILGSITAAGFGVAFKRKKNSIKEE
jgi:hypothetical protein